MKLPAASCKVFRRRRLAFVPLSSDICALLSVMKLSAAGARYSFCQDSMNFFQQAAGLHASGK